MLSPQKKQRIINKFKTHEKDTGSAEVQIAILSEEIKELTKHLRSHKHDHSSRRGLLKKLGERRRLLRYLESDNPKSFEKMIKELNIKISIKIKAEEPEELLKEMSAEKKAEVKKAEVNKKDS